jgi:hypothetical protein
MSQLTAMAQDYILFMEKIDAILRRIPSQPKQVDREQRATVPKVTFRGQNRHTQVRLSSPAPTLLRGFENLAD